MMWPIGGRQLFGTKLAPGEYRAIDTADKLPTYEANWGIKLGAIDYTLNIYGTIGYHDEDGRKMETGFDRNYDLLQLRFITDEDT